MREAVGERAPAARADAGRLPRHVRMFLRLSRRELPAPVCGVTVEHGIAVPAADGVPLLTDHYVPLLAGPRPTLLVRTPYGRGFPWDYVYGALFAGQGFHVIIQSCRGTGGSGGEFEPFVNEAADSQAAVAWLRGQDWFSGALGTVGASYLGFTQWALALDPPPELGAMIVQVSADDFYSFLYPGGALALEPILVGAAAMQTMHRGAGQFALAIARLLRHRRRAERTLPLLDAYRPAAGQRLAWLERWLAHPAPDDPFWAPRRAVAASAEQIPPTSLLTGWWDVCLDQTLAQYQRLRAAGRPVRLVVGPWTHTSGFNRDMPVLLGEALGWLHGYLEGDQDGLPARPVRLHISEAGGPGEWHDLPDWPLPDAAPRRWHVHGDGTLAPEPPAAVPAEEATGAQSLAGAGARTGPAAAQPSGPTAVSSFRYDPAAPTPSVGGPSMDNNNCGARRNDALEARADVLTFTGPALSEPLEVIGPVSVRLRVSGSSPHFDVFARLCDVDPRGRSWNVCDGLLRLGGGSTAVTADSGTGGAADGAAGSGAGGGGWQDITVPMSATAHRFGAGHRLRLQVSGGAHPRFMRNTGTGEPLATATRLVPVDIQIRHDPDRPCVLTLPVAPASAGR